MNGKTIKGKRGRPHAFDADQALDSAMQVFWRKRYLGTSQEDLTEPVDLNRPSFYAAFGNKKKTLYRVALALRSRTALAGPFSGGARFLLIFRQNFALESATHLEEVMHRALCHPRLTDHLAVPTHDRAHSASCSDSSRSLRVPWPCPSGSAIPHRGYRELPAVHRI